MRRDRVVRVLHGGVGHDSEGSRSSVFVDGSSQVRRDQFGACRGWLVGEKQGWACGVVASVRLRMVTIGIYDAPSPISRGYLFTWVPSNWTSLSTWSYVCEPSNNQ